MQIDLIPIVGLFLWVSFLHLHRQKSRSLNLVLDQAETGAEKTQRSSCEAGNRTSLSFFLSREMKLHVPLTRQSFPVDGGLTLW